MALVKNSSPRIDVKAEGTADGADSMLKIEAVGNLILKVGAAIGAVLTGAAALVAALARAGLFVVTN